MCYAKIDFDYVSEDISIVKEYACLIRGYGVQVSDTETRHAIECPSFLASNIYILAYTNATCCNTEMR